MTNPPKTALIKAIPVDKKTKRKILAWVWPGLFILFMLGFGVLTWWLDPTLSP